MTRHNLLAYFVHNFSKTSSLSATAYYTTYGKDNRERIGAENVITAVLRQEDNRFVTDYDMFAVKADCKWRFDKRDSEAVGLYYGTSSTDYLSEYLVRNNQSTRSKNTWLEGYYNFNYAKSPVKLLAAVRARYEKQHLKNHITEQQTFDKDYFNVVPQLRLTYALSKSTSVVFNYKYGFSLPKYSQLNPAVRIENLIFHRQGNPDLKVTKSHNLSLAANIKGLTLSAEYVNYRNRIMNTVSPMEDGENLLVMPINLSGNFTWDFAAEYNWLPVKGFRTYARVQMTDTHTSFYNLGELVRRSKLSVECNLNLNYSFAKRYNAFVSFRYNSPFLYDNTSVTHSEDLSLGMDGTFCKGKLTVRVEAKDLLGRAVTPYWEEYSPCIYRARANRYDVRGVSVSVRYKFTAVKNSYRMQSANAEEAARADM